MREMHRGTAVARSFRIFDDCWRGLGVTREQDDFCGRGCMYIRESYCCMRLSGSSPVHNSRTDLQLTSASGGAGEKETRFSRGVEWMGQSGAAQGWSCHSTEGGVWRCSDEAIF